MTSGHGQFHHIDEVVQERRNSSASAMELRLSCTKPSIYWPFVKETTIYQWIPNTKGHVMQNFSDLLLAKNIVKQSVESLVICNDMTLMWRHCDYM